MTTTMTATTFSTTTKTNTKHRWYPTGYLIEQELKEDTDSSIDSILERLEQESIQLAATLIRPHLYRSNSSDDDEDDRDNSNHDSDGADLEDGDTESTGSTSDEITVSSRNTSDDENEDGHDDVDDQKMELPTSLDHGNMNRISELVRGRFVDMCCTKEGEHILESLFLVEPDDVNDDGKQIVDAVVALIDAKDNIIRGAVIAIQSLILLGMQYGATLTPEKYESSVAHLEEPDDDRDSPNDIWEWTQDSTRRLKRQGPHDDYKVAGLQLLAALKRRRGPVGAADLLTRIGAWTKHENLVLLRSGFPIHFSDMEKAAATALAAACEDNEGTTDPDSLLQLRKDLRHQKVYTIDSASTTEIDDGLAVEEIEVGPQGAGGEQRSKSYRYWIHIADADKWAPRDSDLFKVARRRATSIYMPDGKISMFPASVSSQMMSLKANTDSYAMSLGVELDDDGSIIDESIIVCPSLIRVSYRLTYDDVDEMLEDGVGYQEEWQLGKLYVAAQKRRTYRIKRGSAEAFVPNQIPRYSIYTVPDNTQPDNIGIKVSIQVSHNGGMNQSSAVAISEEDIDRGTMAEQLPVSSSSTLVTEMMILAGEALGKWGVAQKAQQEQIPSPHAMNPLRLPYRAQSRPDYRSRSREKKIMMDLLAYNVGGGYCHAWYARRFLSRVQISDEASPHGGLGLDCYVQWSSPIRRFQDLQAHAAIKRYLRRQKVQELLRNDDVGVGQIPDGIDPMKHLGCELSSLLPVESVDDNDCDDGAAIDDDIDYQDRTKLLGPASFVNNKSNEYWMMEYVRRLVERDPGTTFTVLVLGCVNPSRRQYAIYVYDLGLESRYTSPVGLQAGDQFNVRIANVRPQNGQLTFVRVQ